MASGTPREKASQRLQLLTGLQLERAAKLVNATIDGATDHALELINGFGPVPTSMTTARADQLRYICERVGRLVTQREVEVLFRVTSTTARSILTTLQATYAEALRTKFLDRMRDDVKVIAAGNQTDGLRWKLRFTETNTCDAAVTELARQGLAGEIASEGPNALSVPQTVTVEDSSVDPLKALDIPRPISRGKRA